MPAFKEHGRARTRVCRLSLAQRLEEGGWQVTLSGHLAHRQSSSAINFLSLLFQLNRQSPQVIPV